MTWNDLMDRLKASGLNPVEETYMEHYGKVLAAQRREFRDRYFRCTYGAINCVGVSMEFFMFPWEGHATEFIELFGENRDWSVYGNLVLHFLSHDPEVERRVINAISA